MEWFLSFSLKYPTLDLGLCIYIKWLFNQMTLDSNRKPLRLEIQNRVLAGEDTQRGRNIVSEGLANLVNLSVADGITSQTLHFSLAPAPAGLWAGHSLAA